MDSLSGPIKIILKEKNTFEHSISFYCQVLSFLPYFEDISERDYIKYHNDHTFEYTPQFYSFIKSLFDSKIVADEEEMSGFLKLYASNSAYKYWIRDMNKILNDDKYLENINLSFIRKAFFSMIKFEELMPGSWGIDVETGNWFKILKQMKRIFPQIYKCEKDDMN